ncbi:MAG TPA: hypothetical protein VEY07_08230 [Thermoplasmata archaeon]|nr:hypothetical protein [Thermoplasmata archaeon]
MAANSGSESLEPVNPGSIWMGRLLLSRLRASVRSRTYRRIWILTTVAYVVISLFIGQNIVLIPPGPNNAEIPLQVFWIGYGQVNNPYLAPALLVLSPIAIIALPFWGTLAMVLLGVGIGLSVSSTVAVFVAQRRRQAEVAASGIAPAVTGWAFLGACCCTTCAAQVAATGVVGALVGSTPSALLTQQWPLAVLQLGVVALSLVYLEYRLERPPAPSPRPVSTPQLVGSLAIRVALLVAAVTWLFAVVVEWSAGVPLTAATTYHWLVEHGTLSAAALFAALSPAWLGRSLGRRGFPRLAARALLVVGAVTWGVWVPPVLVAQGLGGFLNELMGYIGAPAAWGAVSPDASVGAALLFHWGFQHLLLAGWALAVALFPTESTTAIAIGEEAVVPSGRAPASRLPAPVAEVETGP